MPTAPCPAAGKDCSTSINEAIRSASPKRIKPAEAKIMASYSPLSNLLNRVPTLPRKERISRSGRNCFNWH